MYEAIVKHFAYLETLIPTPSLNSACVRHMDGGDFFGSEQSYIMPSAGSVKITLHPSAGAPVVLKESLALLEGEVIDASKMSVASLVEFFEKEITDSFDSQLMMSLHMKATMMKVAKNSIVFKF